VSTVRELLSTERGRERARAGSDRFSLRFQSNRWSCDFISLKTTTTSTAVISQRQWDRMS